MADMLLWFATRTDRGLEVVSRRRSCDLEGLVSALISVSRTWSLGLEAGPFSRANFRFRSWS